MSKKSLRDLLMETKSCVLAPCVYDCASARAVELVGFKSMMLSGGEMAIAMNGLIDYGFNNLTDLEWVVSRVAQNSPLAFAVDIDDGFGGPLAVYRACRRLAKAGAHALQMEDGTESDGRLVSRDDFYMRVQAAVDALKGTDCMLIARTNANPATELDEGCERCRKAVELGAGMTTVVRLNNPKDAKYVASKVPGLKMYPDVSAKNGVPELTVEEAYRLGFNYMTMHYLLKAAMDGMLEHGKKNFAQQGCLYTCEKQDATGVLGESASPLFEPQGYIDFEARYTHVKKEYTIGSHKMAPLSDDFVHTPIEERF